MVMKTALVTGASKGLGLEWCRQLGRDGYTVILTARRQDQAAKAAQDLMAEGSMTVVPKALDVAVEDDIAGLASDVAKEFGQLDVLINNAGLNSKDDPVMKDKSTYLKDLDPDEILRHVRINSVSPIIMVKHFRDLLKKSQRPCVLSISSWLGSIGIKTTNRAHYSYATSKAALNMMNRAMSIELQDDGIITLVLNPGWVQTDMGGDAADLTAEQSVRGAIDNVLNVVSLDDTGKFFQWDGTTHPW